MGVIRRQSLKFTLVNLMGLAIGAISTLFVYAHVLEAYGLVQILLAFCLVCMPLLALGANTIAIRFFPRFQDKNAQHNGFLPLLMMLCLFGSLVFSGVGYLLRDVWVGRFSSQNELMHQYYWIVFPLSFFFTVSTVLAVYCSNFRRIVVPSLLLDFSMKLAIPFVLICVWKGWLSLGSALYVMLIHGFLVMLGHILYLRWLGEWYWKPQLAFLTPALRKEIFSFILFGAFGAFALQMATKADTLYVGTLSNIKAAGIYNIAAYIAAAIDIPTRSLYGASASFVAKYLADDNKKELGILYKKVSINLLIAGITLFGAAWISVDSLFQIIPNGAEVAIGKNVLLIIGFSRIIEMASGLNHYMVYYSKFYLWSLLSLGILAFVTLALNIWLVPILGLSGTAVATLVSVTAYNAFNIGLVWWKFKLQPFTKGTLLALLAGCIAFGIAYFIPLTQISILDIVVRSGAFVVLFLALTLLLQVSEDMNGTVKMLRGKYF